LTRCRLISLCITICPSFSFNATATPDTYTLSLHDALPIYREARITRIPVEQDVRRLDVAMHDTGGMHIRERVGNAAPDRGDVIGDRKSTRLNSSHRTISYAVFCLKKKKISTVCVHSPSWSI